MPAFVLPSDDAWSGYARLRVSIGGEGAAPVVVRAASSGTTGRWPWASTEPVFILTAWDPGVERLGLEVNRSRQVELEAELRPLVAELWPAAGRDPATGAEDEGVAVQGIAEAEVLGLGARYRQDAVFAWTPREWSIVACDGRRRVVSGWSVSTGSWPAG